MYTYRSVYLLFECR